MKKPAKPASTRRRKPTKANGRASMPARSRKATYSRQEDSYATYENGSLYPASEYDRKYAT